MPRMPRLYAALTLVLALALPAHATVRFVDGACSSSGTGLSMTCGTSGPLVTINECIDFMLPGDFCEIRGPHDTFTGVYNEEIFMAPGRPGTLPPYGRALACTAGARCTVEGCQAARCGADELPTIRGMVLRTDWTSMGGGVYRRAMEATPHDETTNSGRSDGNGAFDPYVVYESTDSGVTFTPMAYSVGGDNQVIPADGSWSFCTNATICTLRAIYVNPTGAGDPATTVYVPNLSNLAYSAQPSAYFGLNALRFEGTRGVALDIGQSGAPQGGVQLTNLYLAHMKRIGIHFQRLTPDALFDNIFIEDIGRGESFQTSTSDSSYGMRGFHSDGITLQNSTVQLGGNDGLINFSGSNPHSCSWCAPPWNDVNHTYASNQVIGIQIKQTNNATVRNNAVVEMQSGGISVDTCNDSIVERNVVTRVANGISISDFTPDHSGSLNCNPSDPLHFCHASNNIIRENRVGRAGIGSSERAAILLNGTSSGVWRSCTGCTPQTFYAYVYNNMITEPGYAGIMVQTQASRADNINNTLPSGIIITQNTVANANPTADSDNLSRGIVVEAAESTNGGIVIDRNLFDNLTDEAIVIGTAAMAATTVNLDGFGSSTGCPTGCTCDATNLPIRWDATSIPARSASGQPSGGTCGTVASYTTATGQEAGAFAGTLALTAAGKLGVSSVARDTVTCRGLPLTNADRDFENEFRPQGATGTPCDAGADEYFLGTTTTTTVTTTITTTVTTASSTTATTASTITTTIPDTTSTSATTTTIPGGAGTIEFVGVKMTGLQIRP